LILGSGPAMSNFRQIDRETGFLLPPSVDEWLPERHLARFIVEVIAGLDLRSMSGSYRGSGSAPYHPEVLLGLLVYGYATGVFSSRKLERATYDSVAFRFIAANDHPDHDTIATFRRRFLTQIESLFVQVLLLAREMGVLKLGTVGLDGTKIHTNASRHSALSYEHAGNIETQLKAEVADLMAKAEAAASVQVAACRWAPAPHRPQPLTCCPRRPRPAHCSIARTPAGHRHERPASRVVCPIDQHPGFGIRGLAARVRGLGWDLECVSSFDYARRLPLDRKLATTTFHDITRLNTRMRVSRDCHTRLYGHVHNDGRVAPDRTVNLRQNLARHPT
jgi:transposase